MLRTNIVAVVSAIALAGMVGSVKAEPVKLKFAAFEPGRAFGPKRVYKPWIDMVNKASDGTLNIELFAGSQLGKPVAQLKIVQAGIADMALIIPSFTPGRFPGNEIGELPFLWSDPTVAGIAVSRLVEKGILRYPGVKVLGVDMTGPYLVHSTKPITRFEDIKGLKIRAAGPVFAAITRAFGATPVGMPPPSLAENISRGVIDGALLDWTISKIFRIVDVTHHHYEFPLGGVIAILGMNEKKYASLPSKAKAAIDKYSGTTFAKIWGKVIKDVTGKIVGATKADKKHVITYATPEQSKRFRAALQPVVDNWANKSPKNARMLAAFKAEIAAAKRN